MATDFNNLKLVDEHTKLLGHGYLRELNNRNNPVPKEIIFMCILYSYQFEQFGQHTPKITLSSNGHILNVNNVATISTSKEFGAWENVYGEYEIDIEKQPNCAILEWTFKINAFYVSLGLCSINRKLSETDKYCFDPSVCADCVYYALGDTGLLEYRDNNNKFNKDFYSKRTRKGDTIKMILNMKEKSLTFIRNKENIGIAYSEIDATKIYCLAVSIYFEINDYVEMTEFSVSYE